MTNPVMMPRTALGVTFGKAMRGTASALCMAGIVAAGIAAVLPSEASAQVRVGASG